MSKKTPGINDSLITNLPFSNINNYELDCIFNSNVNTTTFNEFIYTTIDDLKSKLKVDKRNHHDRNISLLHINIRSLVKNFDSLHQMIIKLPVKPDLIAITETKLNKNSNINFIQLKNYTFIHNDSNTNAGGVGIYINNSFNFQIRPDLELKHCETESLWASITINQKMKITIGIIYKHPKCQIPAFSEKLSEILALVSNENQKCYITGDFNINLNLENQNATKKYSQMIKSFNYHNVVKYPTRITNKSATCIDHLYTNNKNSITNKFLLLEDISDHLPIFATINNKPITKKCEPIYYRNFNKLNDENFMKECSNEIQKLQLEFSDKPNTDIHTEFQSLNNTLTKTIDKYLPLQRLSKKATKLKQKPWLSKGILKSSKVKNRLYKKLVKTNFRNTDLHSKYKQYRNILTHIIDAAKQKYYQKQLFTSKNDSKRTWQVLNDLIGKNKKDAKLPDKLLCNTKTIQDPKEIANTLNKHFAEIGKTNQNEIDFNYIKKNLNSFQKNSFVFYPATTEEISLIITNLKNKNSEGYDGIPGCVIKKLNKIISPVVTYLINKSISTGKYPNCLKIGKVLPLFKTGKHEDPNNYRPITILPAINKIFEKLIFNRLNIFFEKNQIIKNNQFGFRSGYSTELAMCKFYEDALTSLNEKNAMCAILLDLSKAFDSVNRNILLYKLYNYGIRGPAYTLLESYLSNRKQFIQVNNIKSNTHETNIGVPQGSVISPLLFLIHINDLPNCTNMEVLNFADDTLFTSRYPKIQQMLKIILTLN